MNRRPGLVARALSSLVTRAVTSWGEVGWTIVRGQNPTEFQHTGRNVRQLGWERNAVVHACARVVADIIAAVPLEVYRKQGGDTVVLERHPALDLLNAPRGAMSGYRLRSRTALDYLLFGNGFWHLERNGRGRIPTGIRLIRPEHVQFVYLDPETDEIVRYDWRDLQGRVHRSPVEDVVHIPDLDAADGLFGYPRAAAALQDIVADGEATQYVRQMVKNHGVPGLVVKTKGYKNREQLLAAENAFNERFVARGGRGGAQFINADELELTEIGFNLRDLEFPDLRRIAREDICAAFNVDPRMIGAGSAQKDGGLSGVQFREARFRLIQQTVVPIMKSIESTLDTWFMPEFGDVYVRFSPDGLAELTEDEDATSKRALAEMAAGARTREETRELIGLPADMDPAHTLVGPVNRVEYPVALQFAHTEPDPADEPTPAANPSPEAASDGAPSAAPDQRRSPAPRSRVIRRGVTLTAEQRTLLWGHFDQRATKQEAPYRRTALQLFQAEQAGVQALFDAAADKLGRAVPVAPGAVRASEDEDPELERLLAELQVRYGTGGDYYDAWLARYRGLLGETMGQAGADLAASLGVDFALENPEVLEAIARRTNKLAGAVCDTTYDQIQGVVAAGRQAGFGVREIGAMVNDTVFERQAPKRAVTIARTESVGALNEGEYLAALGSGVMHSKEWLTQGDERVSGVQSPTERDGRPHLPLDGVRIDIATPFTNGLQFPGDQAGEAADVINCRCTLLFYDEEAP